jgi:hypothetical protein
MEGMGQVHSAQPMDKVRALVTLAVAVSVATACSGDDDGAEPGTTTASTPAVTTTEPETTEPAATTTDPPTTSASPTTLPATTTLDVEALKAQIAADYERAWQSHEELVTNPTLDQLDDRLAQFVAPGSDSFNSVKAFVERLVADGQRVINGDPDYSTVTVEMVELIGGPPYAEATVTACQVTNRIRVDSAGVPAQEPALIAIRQQQTVQRTLNGWLPSSNLTGLEQGDGITECPPPGS